MNDEWKFCKKDDPFQGPRVALIYCCLVAKLCLTLCKPLDCSMPGFPVLHYHLPQFAQTQAYWVGNAFQPSHSLSPPSPSAFSLFQNQDLFIELALCIRWKVLELQLQQKFFLWVFKVDFPFQTSIDWPDLLAVQRTLKNLLQHCDSKASIVLCSAFFMNQLTSVRDYWKHHSFEYMEVRGLRKHYYQQS